MQLTQMLDDVVRALVPDTHPAAALALLQVGSVSLIARLTHWSADRLRLAPGVAPRRAFQGSLRGFAAVGRS